MDTRPTHGRRPSQAYRAAGRSVTFSPLARYLHLAQSVGFWSSLLFVSLYVFDLDLFFSSSSTPAPSSPSADFVDSGGSPAGDVDLNPRAGEPAYYPPPRPALGFAFAEGDRVRGAGGSASYLCFGKPCIAEEYDYVMRTHGGITKDSWAASGDEDVAGQGKDVPKKSEIAATDSWASPTDNDGSDLVDKTLKEPEAAPANQDPWDTAGNKYPFRPAYEAREDTDVVLGRLGAMADRKVSGLTGVPEDAEAAARVD